MSKDYSGVKVRARKAANRKRICRRKSGKGWKAQSKRASQYK